MQRDEADQAPGGCRERQHPVHPESRVAPGESSGLQPEPGRGCQDVRDQDGQPEQASEPGRGTIGHCPDVQRLPDAHDSKSPGTRKNISRIALSVIPRTIVRDNRTRAQETILPSHRVVPPGPGMPSLLLVEPARIKCRPGPRRPVSSPEKSRKFLNNRLLGRKLGDADHPDRKSRPAVRPPVHAVPRPVPPPCRAGGLPGPLAPPALLSTRLLAHLPDRADRTLAAIRGVRGPAL